MKCEVIMMDEIKALRCESVEDTIQYILNSDIDESQKDLILMFINELKIKGFSPFRIMSYAFTLLELARITKRSFRDLSDMDFRQYVYYLLNRKNNKHSTIKEKMMRIRVFLRWLLNLPPRAMPDALSWFFMIKPRSTKGSKELRILEKLISYDEYIKLIEASRNNRDKALLQFMYESGARILEILKVKIKDVHLDQNYAIVGDGKRLVPLSNTNYIKKWLEEHPLKNENSYLFCNLKDPRKPMSYQAVRKLLHRLCKKAGLTRKITPHMFRHSRATLLAKLGVSPYAMNQVMGWSSNTKMWQIYLHITQKDALYEVLKKTREVNNKI